MEVESCAVPDLQGHYQEGEASEIKTYKDLLIYENSMVGGGLKVSALSLCVCGGMCEGLEVGSYVALNLSDQCRGSLGDWEKER